jgi:hypothetical protein
MKPYKIFESVSLKFPKTRNGVVKACKKYNIENYTINDDLSIDVDGDVDLNDLKLMRLPLRFSYVSGSFSCNFNKLKSLEGCPQTVGGSFSCHGNGLESLEGGPQIISGGFYCFLNNLKTLVGGPQTVGGIYMVHRNKLETLKGSPQTVGGDFLCNINRLTDLEHFPEVNGIIDIEENKVYLLVYTFIRSANSFLIEDFIDYEIVRNRDTVMLDRLQTFIRDNDLEMPDLEKIKKEYKIIE